MEWLIRKKVSSSDFILAIGVPCDGLNHLVIKTDTFLVFCVAIFNYCELHRDKDAIKIDIGAFQNCLSQGCRCLTSVDDLHINQLGNHQFPINGSYLYICGSDRDAIVICKKSGGIRIDCPANATIDTFGSAGSKKRSNISFQYLAAMFNINARKELSRNNGNISSVAQVITHVAFDAWDASIMEIREIGGNVNHYRFCTVRTFHLIETLQIPQVDFQRLTIEVRFLDFPGSFGTSGTPSRFANSSFEEICFKQMRVQLLIGQDK